VKIEDPEKTVEKEIILNIRELIKEVGRIGEMALIVEKLIVMTCPKVKLLRLTTYYPNWKISLNNHNPIKFCKKRPFFNKPGTIKYESLTVSRFTLWSKK